MDKLGDWIYILIIILIPLIKLLFEKPKKEVSKEAKPFQIPGHPAGKSDWEEMFHEKKDPEKKPVTKSQKVQKTALNQTVMPESVDRRIKKTVEPEKTDGYNELAGQIFNDPDDLRKAIIASEILARKF